VPPATEFAHFLGGFVAGEGSFIVTGLPPTFTFAVGMSAADAALCEQMQEFFGCGSLVWFRRRKPHYDGEVRYQVRSLADLVYIVVPFMDDHLPPSHKRLQYETWRAALLDYWETKAKRRRPCTVPGCSQPARALGRCRRHYYELTGR
jgi:hypothetical protein